MVCFCVGLAIVVYYVPLLYPVVLALERKQDHGISPPLTPPPPTPYKRNHPLHPRTYQLQKEHEYKCSARALAADGHAAQMRHSHRRTAGREFV